MSEGSRYVIGRRHPTDRAAAGEGDGRSVGRLYAAALGTAGSPLTDRLCAAQWARRRRRHCRRTTNGRSIGRTAGKNGCGRIAGGPTRSRIERLTDRPTVRPTTGSKRTARARGCAVERLVGVLAMRTGHCQCRSAVGSVYRWVRVLDAMPLWCGLVDGLSVFVLTLSVRCVDGPCRPPATC